MIFGIHRSSEPLPRRMHPTVASESEEFQGKRLVDGHSRHRTGCCYDFKFAPLEIVTLGLGSQTPLVGAVFQSLGAQTLMSQRKTP